ncbi:hypothetical protein [Treponema sp.]|uniref:hypothetical protein n=1 Tax=Treponema sp. TaxID=166 RepID=UPI003EFD3A5B
MRITSLKFLLAVLVVCGFYSDFTGHSVFYKKFAREFFALVDILFVAPVNVFAVQTQSLFFYTAGLCWGKFNFPLFEKIDRIGRGEAVVLFLFT